MTDRGRAELLDYLHRELLAHEDSYEIVTFDDTQKAPRGFAYETQTAFA